MNDDGLYPGVEVLNLFPTLRGIIMVRKFQTIILWIPPKVKLYKYQEGRERLFSSNIKRKKKKKKNGKGIPEKKKDLKKTKQKKSLPRKCSCMSEMV